jgi:hypothetical protein
MKLIGAVFKEFEQIIDYAYMFDILKMKCIYHCLKKDYVKAIKFISKYVHENPHESKGWIELCLCLKRAGEYNLALNIGQKILLTNVDADLVI